MRPEDFDIHKIIDSLQGTCNTIQSAIDDYYPGMDENDLTSSDHDAIDNTIFLCATCGWWCETGEANESEGGEDVCNDCKEDED